jgi:ELWxxDGT repeat protein
LFAGNDGQNGIELWVSNGTAAGTSMVADLRAGSGSSSPAEFARVGALVFFAADDGATGTELWSMHLGLIGGAFADRYGTGCPGTGGLVAESFGVGLPVLGNSGFGIQVTKALANSAAVLLAHYSSTPLDVGGGCVLYPTLPVLIVLATPTDGAGSGIIGLSIPNDPSLVGGSLHSQWVVADPNGALFGIASLSDGLHVLIGN